MKNSRWIRIEDEPPPESDVEYLICTKDKYIHICKFLNYYQPITDKFNWLDFDTGYIEDIEYWMPLPQPPEDE